jgi:hypothetical protein
MTTDRLVLGLRGMRGSASRLPTRARLLLREALSPARILCARMGSD